jgi:DnaJ-domain-containing protein 1
LVKPFEARRLVELLKPGAASSSAGAGAGARPTASRTIGAPASAAGEIDLLQNPVLFVLWRAARERQSGVLELFAASPAAAARVSGAGEADGGEKARVFLLDGQAVFAQHSAAGLHVGAELVRAGHLRPTIHKRACALAVERSCGLLEVLQRESLADDAAIQQAYQALVPRVLERIVALSGRGRMTSTMSFIGLIPQAPTPVLAPLLAGLRQTGAAALEPHVGPRRALRLAPGEAWTEVVPHLASACGGDSVAHALDGQATVGALLDAAPGAHERAACLRQIYLLMSTQAVRASLEPMAVSQTVRASPGAPTGWASASPPVTHTPARAGSQAPVIDVTLDHGKTFTPEAQEARRRIDARFEAARDADHFAILGVPRTADAATLKKAYLQLAREFHTDTFAGLDIGSAQAKLDHVFQAIQTAHATLSDPAKRGEYEAQLSFKAAGASTDIAAILAAEAELHKVKTLIERSELAGALKLLDKIAQVMPNNDEVLGYKAYCRWWQTRNAAQAAAVAKEIEGHARAAPGALMLRELQGWLLMEAGDLQGAKAAFKRVLDVDRANTGATRGMRQLQKKLEDGEKKGFGLGKLLKR